MTSSFKSTQHRKYFRESFRPIHNSMTTAELIYIFQDLVRVMLILTERAKCRFKAFILILSSLQLQLTDLK